MPNDDGAAVYGGCPSDSARRWTREGQGAVSKRPLPANSPPSGLARATRIQERLADRDLQLKSVDCRHLLSYSTALGENQRVAERDLRGAGLAPGAAHFLTAKPTVEPLPVIHCCSEARLETSIRGKRRV